MSLRCVTHSYIHSHAFTNDKQKQVELHPPTATTTDAATLLLPNAEDNDDSGPSSSSSVSPRVRFSLYKLFWAAGQPARALGLLTAFAQRLEEEGVGGGQGQEEQQVRFGFWLVGEDLVTGGRGGRACMHASQFTIARRSPHNVHPSIHTYKPPCVCIHLNRPTNHCGVV